MFNYFCTVQTRCSCSHTFFGHSKPKLMKKSAFLFSFLIRSHFVRRDFYRTKAKKERIRECDFQKVYDKKKNGEDKTISFRGALRFHNGEYEFLKSKRFSNFPCWWLFIVSMKIFHSMGREEKKTGKAQVPHELKK